VREWSYRPGRDGFGRVSTAVPGDEPGDARTMAKGWTSALTVAARSQRSRGARLWLCPKRGVEGVLGSVLVLVAKVEARRSFRGVASSPTSTVSCDMLWRGGATH
jgi:hypothetical protein